MTNAQTTATAASCDAPRVRFAVGLGCRRASTVEQIEAAVFRALGRWTIGDVQCMATIETKAQEPALVAFCTRHRLPLVAFNARAIDTCFETHQGLHRSPEARAHAGVWGVCEPCALLAAPGGTLWVPKQVHSGVTVAIAMLPPGAGAAP